MMSLNDIVDTIDVQVLRELGEKNDAGELQGVTNSTRSRRHFDAVYENKVLEFRRGDDLVEGLVGIRHVFSV